MCYVIVTCRTALWALMSLGATLVVIAGMITPHWIMGKEEEIDYPGWYVNVTTAHFRPSLGIFNGCARIPTADMTLAVHCAVYVTSLDMPSDDFPSLWKCSLILFTIASFLLSTSLIMCLLSLCLRAICTKSVFTIAGFVQSLAGFFLVVGLLLYPAGWGSQKVRTLCGDNVSPYHPHDCSLGWSFYVTAGGAALVLIAALLSILAENSTVTDKVEMSLENGINPVCVC